MSKNLMTHTITLSHISQSFQSGLQETRVLSDVSTSFEQGKHYAITGVSGAGKSTLIHIIAGIQSPTAGQVFFNNEPLTAIHRNQVGVLFQQPYLIKELSVLENVMIKGLIHTTNAQAVQEEALALLQAVGLADKVHQVPGQLSGGQQQRVALARALMGKPAFLLADEPTGSLDVKTGRDIMQLLLQVSKLWNMGLIISSHEPYVYEQMEQIMVLRDGTLQ